MICIAVKEEEVYRKERGYEAPVRTTMDSQRPKDTLLEV